MRSLPLIVLVFVVMLVACKTTEENYRQAYETAVGNSRESSALDSTIYNRMRNNVKTSALAVGSDTMPMRIEYIGYTKDGGAMGASVKKFNVVVGQFKQVFNAQQMRLRLIASGYDSAFIVNTREPLYYVCTATCSSVEEVAQEMKKVRSDESIVLKAPLPFVLRPAHFGSK